MATTTGGPRLPAAAGELSAAVIATLKRHAGDDGCDLQQIFAQASPGSGQALLDDDFQLALYMLYELHYRGFAAVAEEWEWSPALLAFRGRLERRFLTELMDLVGPPLGQAQPEEMDLRLRAIIDGDEGPSLSRYLEARASMTEFLEFVIHRSAYQLKEADPHSWAIPRLGGAAKAALLEIQSDEYGEGELEAMHSTLFARTMEALGLDARYGAYLELLPGVTLATVNLMSLFGLHRRWRGALVGHLAAFEMSSPLPNRRYGNALRRLGAPDTARGFYDVHVLADAVHEQVAAVDLAGGLVRQQPTLAADVLFGARALVALDGRFASYVLGRWEREESSLRGERAPFAAEADQSGALDAVNPIAL